jgi:cytoskeletal protein RodZ
MVMPEEEKPKKTEVGKIGPQLKERRKQLRLSLAQIEIETKIRGKFLTALESGDYSTLPNDIYSRGFVQHYANHLGLDGVKVAADYAAERGGVTAGETRRPVMERPKQIVFTGRILALFAGLGAIGVVFAYLLWQFSALAGAPRLNVDSPEADQAISGSVIEVSGKTTPGSDIFVNDSPVLTDTDGNFSEKVALQDGVNAIRIMSRSKLGKSTTVTRNVLATLPKVDAAQAVVPAAVFDGVAVAVSVKEPTSVVVLADGKEVWRATVPARWSRTFTAKDKVSITTGNAGVTSLAITNKTVANKIIDKLGADGEIRRNQEFAKDTVIP